MQGFFWPHQTDLTKEYVGRFFNEVRNVFQTRDKDFATAYFHTLYPHHLLTEEVTGGTEDLIGTLAPDEPLLDRSLREALDEVRRAAACRDFAAS